MTWPTYAKIDAGRRLRAGNTVRRTEFEDGAIRQARRYTAAPVHREITSWLLGSTEAGTVRSADEDLARFRTWAASNAHLPFTFTDETGADISVRVIGGEGGIEYEAEVSEAGARVWRLSLEVETI